MTKSAFEKYFVRNPIYEFGEGVKNRQSPNMTYMSSEQVPEANYYVTLSWIYGIPEPNPSVHEHVLDYDQILLYVGGDSSTPQDLGGEIEFYIEGQLIKFNTTTGVFIPKGTSRGPMKWKNFRYPHLEIAITLGTGDLKTAWGKSGIKESKHELPVKKDDFDYEQYVIRSPLRESGDFFTQGRQSPTMTYMSRNQINIANYYIEFGWIYGIPKPDISEMLHQKYEELVLHIGGDPQNPKELGADMQFGLGGEIHSFNSTFATFIPRGLRHGPLVWKEVRKPHIEMAIMLGAGTLAEGWADSQI